MYTDEDRRRLLESRHDLGACADAAVVTTDPAFQGAVAASHADLNGRRDALRVAASVVSKEQSETDVERAALQAAVSALVRRYGFVRGKVQDGLLNVDPDNPPAAAEMARRTRLFQRVFRAAPSDLENIGQRSVIEALSAVVKALGDEADLQPFDFATSLGTAHHTAEAAAGNLDRETTEDGTAMFALRAARADLDRTAAAHALLIESVLVRAGRKGDLGHFVLARDPAYAARRTARVPIAEEPGAATIDTEPPPPPPT